MGHYARLRSQFDVGLAFGASLFVLGAAVLMALIVYTVWSAA